MLSTLIAGVTPAQATDSWTSCMAALPSVTLPRDALCVATVTQGAAHEMAAIPFYTVCKVREDGGGPGATCPPPCYWDDSCVSIPEVPEAPCEGVEVQGYVIEQEETWHHWAEASADYVYDRYCPNDTCTDAVEPLGEDAGRAVDTALSVEAEAELQAGYVVGAAVNYATSPYLTWNRFVSPVFLECDTASRMAYGGTCPITDNNPFPPN